MFHPQAAAPSWCTQMLHAVHIWEQHLACCLCTHIPCSITVTKHITSAATTHICQQRQQCYCSLQILYFSGFSPRSRLMMFTFAYDPLLSNACCDAAMPSDCNAVLLQCRVTAMPCYCNAVLLQCQVATMPSYCNACCVTCSCDTAMFSISMEEIHSPPDLMTSLLRSVMRM